MSIRRSCDVCDPAAAFAVVTHGQRRQWRGEAHGDPPFPALPAGRSLAAAAAAVTVASTTKPLRFSVSTRNAAGSLRPPPFPLRSAPLRERAEQAGSLPCRGAETYAQSYLDLLAIASGRHVLLQAHVVSECSKAVSIPADKPAGAFALKKWLAYLGCVFVEITGTSHSKCRLKKA
jgi:hypothetical protein